MNAGQVAKAIVGALIAFLGALATAATSGGISLQEWLFAAVAGLVSLGGVYQVTNSGGSTVTEDPAPTHDPQHAAPDPGVV